MLSLCPFATVVLIALAAARASATETRRDILTHHHHHHHHHTAKQLRTLATANVEDQDAATGDADLDTAGVVEAKQASSEDSDVDTSASDAAQSKSQDDTSVDGENEDSKDSGTAANVAAASDADASADTASADTDVDSSDASVSALTSVAMARKSSADTDADTDGDSSDAAAAAPAGAPSGAPAAGPAGPSSAEAEKKALKEMKDMLESERETFEDNDPASKLREELASLIWLQDELKDQWAALAEPVYTAKIDMEQKVVDKETGMPGTANMLGNMRREMHKYASPFYRKVLEKQIANLQAEQKRVSLEIDDIEDEQQGKEKKEAKKEKKKMKRARTEAKAAPAPEEAASVMPATPAEEVGVQKMAHIAGVGLVTLLVLGMFVCLCLLYTRSAHRD